MRDLLQDLSTLTGIGKLPLQELADKAVAVISHDVEETLRNKEKVTTVDIGIGVIHICENEDTLVYKFVPSLKLDRAVVNTYTNRKSQLCLEIDETLGKRLTTTYKDLF